MPVSPLPVVIMPVVEDVEEDKGKKKEEEDKGKEIEEEEGVWERKYGRDGEKYWEHSGTKKRLPKDPFF